MNTTNNVPTAESSPATLLPWQTIATDRVAMPLLVGSILLLVALWLLVIISISSLPDLLPLHFDTLGQPDRIGERSEVYRLPLIATVIAAINIGTGLWLRFHSERTFSPYLLWAGTLVIMLLFVIGTWNILQ